MQSPEFFEKLSRGLKVRGVTARAERQLAAEFQDHFQCGFEERLEQGMSSSDAETAAVAALGDPGYLAEATAEKWRAKLWSNRHPWIFGLVSGVTAYLFASLFVVLAVGMPILIHGKCWVPPGSAVVTAVVFLAALTNWLPALVGGLWMGWQFRTKRFRASTFWIGCLGVALGASLFRVAVVVPTLEHHGSFLIEVGPLAGFLLWPFAILLHVQKECGYDDWRPFLGSTTTWLQMTLTFTFAWAIYALRAISPKVGKVQG